MSTKRKRYLPATSIVGAQKRRLTNSSMPGAPNAADGPGPLLHYVPVLYAQGRAVCLGQGGYGSVFRYKDTLAGQDVAIKRVQLTNLPEHKRELLSRYIPSELKNHFCLHHPHVIKLRDVFVTPHHLNIVLELAEGGMLFDWVNARLKEGGGRMREDDARWFLQQLVLTMDYFHRKGISHRDIKLENTLIRMAPGWSRPVIKVADFGLSKHDATLTFTRVGTSDYMSPEVLTAKRPDGTSFGLGYNGEKSDIFSAGVMLYAMLAGSYPFDANKPDEQRLKLMMQRPLKGLPAGLSYEGRQLLEALLHPNQHERISVQGIMQHPWFLRSLPGGALRMTDDYIDAPSPCARTPQEIEAVIAEACSVLGRGPPAPAPAGP